jgi:hypothetical protein
MRRRGAFESAPNEPTKKGPESPLNDSEMSHGGHDASRTHDYLPGEGARFENRDFAVGVQAAWKRVLWILTPIWLGSSVATFAFLYLYGGGSLLEDFLSLAALVGIFSVVLFGLVARKKAVSTILLDANGITLVTVANLRQTLDWKDPRFRIVLWNRDPSAPSFYMGDDAGVLLGPGGYQGWTTIAARDAILSAARASGIRAWTWNSSAPLPSPLPRRTLLARRLTLVDRFRGLRSDKPDS